MSVYMDDQVTAGVYLDFAVEEADKVPMALADEPVRHGGLSYETWSPMKTAGVLGVDVFDLMHMVGTGELATAKGEDDRFLAADVRRRVEARDAAEREADALLRPSAHASRLHVASTVSENRGTAEESAELARLIGADEQAVRAAALRRGA